MTTRAEGPAGTAQPGHNADVAAIFDESADLLELEEANPFRVRADRNAARVVRDLSQDVTGMVAAGENHTELPDVGEDLAGKIWEIVTTGRCALLSELHKHTSPVLHPRMGRANLRRMPETGGGTPTRGSAGSCGRELPPGGEPPSLP